MRPIAFETLDELSCLSNFTSSEFSLANKKGLIGALVENWKYNLNYWTGGSQSGCKGEWAWCSGSEVADLPDNLTWAFNQPDNKAGADDCLQMRLFQNKSGIALADRNCADKFVIACEVFV